MQKSTAIHLVLASLVVLYSFIFKTFPISEGFWWFGDQIRDWLLVQGSFLSLPGHGTPRVDGYYSMGPAYYWTLWLIRVCLAPFFHMLPHAGGYGISMLNALSEGSLVLALLSAGFSRFLVLAFALLLISSPMESALAGKIWNPPVAVAYAEFALAACLFATKTFSSRRLVVTTILALFALQSHTPVSLVVFCIICFAAFQYKTTEEQSWRHTALILGTTTFLVELRYLIYFWTYGPKVAGTTESVIDSSFQNLLHWNTMGLEKSYQVLESVHNTYIPEGSSFYFFIACLVLLLPLCRKIPYPKHFVILGLAPLILTSLAVSFSTRPLENYFFISLGASLLLIPLFLTEAMSRFMSVRWRQVLGVAVCLLALSLQPSRWEARSKSHVLPEYGLMVRACKELTAKKIPFANIEGPQLAKRTCAKCLFEFLGGKIDPASKFIAKIERDGSTTVAEL